MIIKIVLEKHRSTWHYTSFNDVGGSFGSNHCGTKRVALHKAAIGAKVREPFELFTNGVSEGLYSVREDGQVVKECD